MQSNAYLSIRPPMYRKICLMEMRLNAVKQLAADCCLCPRECHINRLAGQMGTCRTPYGPIYSSANLHYGEEPPISGTRGSGTIFLTGCNLCCVFCQNFPISQLRHGNSVSVERLAELMLKLQNDGAHNINFVTPTHQSAAIYEALLLAYKRGLNIPMVYNTSGYESLEMLKLWDGIVDVYLPDAKYSNDQNAQDVSNAPNYIQHNRSALKEMHRQVGELQTDEQGLAIKGMIIRHLVLPENLSGTDETLKWIADELSPNTFISLMSQYFPAHNAHEHPQLNRTINRTEYRATLRSMERYGLNNGWVQPL